MSKLAISICTGNVVNIQDQLKQTIFLLVYDIILHVMKESIAM